MLTDRVSTPLPLPPLLHTSDPFLRLLSIAPLSGDGGVAGTLPDGIMIFFLTHINISN